MGGLLILDRATTLPEPPSPADLHTVAYRGGRVSWWAGIVAAGVCICHCG